MEAGRTWGSVSTYLVEGQHLTGHLSTIVQGDPHPVVDLEVELDKETLKKGSGP